MSIQPTKQYTPQERQPYGCYAQQRFEVMSKHVFQDGACTNFGDGGGAVMKVYKPGTRGHVHGGVYFLNKTTGASWGDGEFNYADYFPAEMLSVAQRSAS